jgi:hypothetical protein
MSSNRAQGQTLVNSLLLAGLLALAYGTVELHRGSVLLADRLAGEEQRLESIEATVSALAQGRWESVVADRRPLREAAGGSDSGGRGGDESRPALERRLEALENAVDDLLLTLSAQGPVEPPAEEMIEPTGSSGSSPARPAGARAEVVTRHESEWGQSEWGAASAKAITRAFVAQPFFNRHGGDLVADCRQTTCKVEWSLPDLDGMPTEAREEMLALAHYELLALAARHGREVGQLSVKWGLGRELPQIAVVFARRP